MLALLLAAVLQAAVPQRGSDPFAPLAIYDGKWAVTLKHPWSGAAPGAVDNLVSHCTHFTLYFVCEQSVNGTPIGLIVYTVGTSSGRLETRFISPDGTAGRRGELTLDGDRWTYLDKPGGKRKGKWSRVQNYVVDCDHIRLEESESSNEGKTWVQTNSGMEERQQTAGGR